ncbi:TfdA family taurine catabolism dioxygenase TauD [Roseimicrobium gellanilyticum]|uniref:TfdA family taurine catabolism dioxygenase TauD n=1 Tax=Roseimicrobium gellanilyticum TaxID=748857 RepID=A0A366H8U5_9BACT|nr:TauD/TfdA family dioxygenase [Roseimicrobium gellanilyticum]RBP38028.1 TfdA family taurine catabolism dioxygenase TauD [Roseimicrobium gellanilyticum]
MIPREDALQELQQNGYLHLNFAGNQTSAQRFVQSLGELMPQYDKGIAWNVKPRQGQSKMRNSLGKAEIAPHTEFYETPLVPPKYVALYCVEKASCGGGAIAVADMRGFISGMDPKLRKRLETTPFTFSSEAGLRSQNFGSEAIVCPISKDGGSSDVLRFCTGGMRCGQEELVTEYKGALLEYFHEHSRDFVQEPGSLLVWDNHICVHARSTKFTCQKRHLVRYWVSGPSEVPAGQKFKAGIMFADVRGYSKLEDKDKETFHTTTLNKLLEEAMARSGVIQFREQNLWGDGIFCCHDDLGKLAHFAVNLTQAFDDYSAKGGPILRLRTALHYGEVQANEVSLNGSTRSMHHGSDIVTPARLEPVVEPGQVWCTTEAAMMFRKPLAVVPQGYSLKSLTYVRFAKDHGTHFTYWLRKDRENETSLNQAEEMVYSSLSKRNERSRLEIWCDKLLERAQGDFSPPSIFVTWEKLIQRLLYAGACKKALSVLKQYNSWLSKRNLLSSDTRDLLLCMSIRAQKFQADKELDPGFRAYLDELRERSKSKADVRNETLLVIADALMSLALTAEDISDAEGFLSHAYDMYLQILIKPQAALDEEQRNGMRFVGVSYYAEGSRNQHVVLALWALADYLKWAILTPAANQAASPSSDAASMLLNWFQLSKKCMELSVIHSPTSWASFAIAALMRGDVKALTDILDFAMRQDSDPRLTQNYDWAVFHDLVRPLINVLASCKLLENAPIKGIAASAKSHLEGTVPSDEGDTSVS